MEQRKLYEDEWLLIFTGATIVCALLSAMNHGLFFRSPAAAGNDPAPPPAAALAQQAPAPVAAPAANGPKVAGRWLVDQTGAPDADTTTLSSAIANAQAGDRIVVRTGTYAEHLVVSRSLTIVADAGAAPPTILGTGSPAILVDGAELTLTGVSVVHKPNPGDRQQPAVFVRNGTLLAKGIDVSELDAAGASDDACLVLSHGKLDLKDSALGGCAMGIVGAQESSFTASQTKFTNVAKIGVSSMGKSEGSIDHSKFSRVQTALAVGQGASLKATNVEIAEGNRGFEAGPDSTAVLEDAEITDQKSAAVLIDSAIVRIERSRFVRNGYGIAVSHRAILTVSGTKIIDSLKEPYHWGKAENVQFSGGGNEPAPPN